MIVNYLSGLRLMLQVDMLIHGGAIDGIGSAHDRPTEPDSFFSKEDPTEPTITIERMTIDPETGKLIQQ